MEEVLAALQESTRNLVGRLDKLEALIEFPDIDTLEAEIAALQAEIDTLQNPPTAKVQLGSPLGSFPSGAVTVVTGMTVIGALRNFTWASDKLTCQVSGSYLLGWLHEWTTGFGNMRWGAIRLNGGGTFYGGNYATPAGGAINASPGMSMLVVDLDAGSYLELVGFQDSGAPSQINAAIMWAFYVGETPV